MEQNSTSQDFRWKNLSVDETLCLRFSMTLMIWHITRSSAYYTSPHLLWDVPTPHVSTLFSMSRAARRFQCVMRHFCAKDREISSPKKETIILSVPAIHRQFQCCKIIPALHRQCSFSTTQEMKSLILHASRKSPRPTQNIAQVSISDFSSDFWVLFESSR